MFIATRALVRTRADGALVVQLAAQPNGELRLLRLPRREEQRAARQGAAVGEDDPCQRSIVSVEPIDAIFSHPNFRTRESRPVVVVDFGRAIRAEDEVAAPAGELQ